MSTFGFYSGKSPAAISFESHLIGTRRTDKGIIT